MNKIISKSHFSENVVKLVVEAPLIAKARKAGHFVIVRCGEKGERIPLTISDSDVERGTITLVIQAIGESTRKICALNEGDYLTDVVGPLGQATHIENYGTVVCCGGGVGVAPLLPIVVALKAAGNRVVSVLAGRTKELIILEDEIRKHSDEVIIMTDDGSYGKQGLVTAGVEEVIQREKVDKVVTIGPAIMMKFVALLTKKYEVPLNLRKKGDIKSQYLNNKYFPNGFNLENFGKLLYSNSRGGSAAPGLAPARSARGGKDQNSKNVLNLFC
jgi:NAD(P)H-flavin reductase